MPPTVDKLPTKYPVDWLGIVITLPGSFPGGPEEEASALIRILKARAADFAHLRKPETDASYVKAVLELIPSDLRKRIVLHDCFELASEYEVGGVHLNRRNPNAPDESLQQSVSCHSLEELYSLGSDVSYATISPVFDSISKAGYRAICSPEDIAGKLPVGKVIALGGVTPKDLPRLKRAGFAGSAMLGWIWSGDTEQRIMASALRLQLLKAFPLLLITDAPTVEETMVQAAKAYEGGCRWVQVRMKEASTNDRVEATRRIMSECPEMLVTIDDDCEAVRKSGAHGVHLGKEDLSTVKARKIVGEAAIIGRTANTFEDVLRIAGEGGVDYLGVGPLRFTTTKKRLAPSLGFAGYASIADQMRKHGIHLPFLAIGGITTADIPLLLDAGVDGIAVSGAINKASDPIEATERFLKELKKDIRTT